MFDLDLVKEDRLTYEIREIDIDPNNSETTFNRVAVDGQGDWVLPDLANISETKSLFPAVIEKEVISVPEYTDQAQVHMVQYQYKYDDYMNVVEYSIGKAEGNLTQVDVVIDQIEENYYLYIYDSFDLQKLINGDSPFTTPLPKNDPSDPNYYEVECAEDPSYSADIVCDADFLLSDPCDIFPSQENVQVNTVHRKAFTETRDIIQTEYQANITADLIATMSYFDPSNASSQTNLTKTHNVYLGPIHSSNLERKTKVESLDNSNLAPVEIWNYYDATNKLAFDLEYDIYGNVTQVKGPGASASVRATTTYLYDPHVNQFVTQVTNAHNEKNCNLYNIATGNLIKTEDINGNHMQFVYDDFYRLEQVWGPRELEKANSAATIEFEYHLSSTDPAVAVTNHNINEGASELIETQGQTVDCSLPIDLSSRPSISNPLQTATFIDGLQRVIQVKKDASSSNMGVKSKKREVSGIAVIDNVGRTSKTYLGDLEDVSSSIIELNTSVFTNGYLSKIEGYFDYINRPTKVFSRVSDDSQEAYQETSFNYSWQANNGAFEYSETVTTTANSGGSVSQTTKNFINAYGQVYASTKDNNASFTTFDYNALNQLMEVSDPVGVVTEYEYDWLGRIYKEIHDDRGTTDYYYDTEGNLEKIEYEITNNEVTFSYLYNRLLIKSMYTSGSGVVNDVTYTYGSIGDGLNGAGRITKIELGSDYLVDEFKYDVLGNAYYQKRSVEIPKLGKQTYISHNLYDSWGRVKQMIYPDLEIVTYDYSTLGGELESISSNTGQSIIDDIYYDGFGNIKTIQYGNGTQSDYNYLTSTRRLESILSTTQDNKEMINKTFSYDNFGNVSQALNSLATNNAAAMAKDYQNDFEYDSFNRLKKVTRSYNGSASSVALSMSYLADGSISKKYQSDNVNSPALHSYKQDYNYGNSHFGQAIPVKDHQLDYTTIVNGPTRFYSYNDQGSMIGKYADNEGVLTYDVQYAWDEEQKLQGAKNSSGTHHYTYDAAGDRVLKGSMLISSATIVGETPNQAISSMDPYLVYVSPYYVAEPTTNRVEVSKHYFMGSQKVATRLESLGYTAENSSSTPGALEDLKDLIKVFEPNATTSQINQAVDGASVQEVYTQAMYISDKDLCEGEESYDPECLCHLSVYWAELLDQINCEEYTLMYWYHPDYLGNNEFISNINGDPHQYFFYSAFGEALYSEHSNFGTYSSPYRFNGKEFDPETGNYYYGARYYEPQLSCWLSVDPLLHVDPDMTPYHFCNNNPINIIDPDGRTGYFVSSDGSITKMKGFRRFKGGKKFDVLYAKNESGKLVRMQSEFNKGILGSAHKGIYQGDSYESYFIDNEDLATEFFEFAANYSESEFSHVRYSEGGMDGSVVSTSKNKWSEVGGVSWISHLGANKKNSGSSAVAYYLTHSHQQKDFYEMFGFAGPSGEHPMDATIGSESGNDLGGASLMESLFPGIRLAIYDLNTGGKYINYNSQGTLKPVNLNYKSPF